MPSPPSMPPTVDCIIVSILRAASFTAARTKSCSISTSPDFTPSGSIRKLRSCLRPSIFAVTVPPPDEASTTVSCIFFCRVSYCAFAFDIKSCRLNPPIVALALLLVVNHRTNLRPEFFPHALHHGILFCPAAASAIGSLAGPRFCVWLRSSAGRDRCARDYLQLHRPPENSAGRSDCQPSGLGAQRHINYRCRSLDADDQLVPLYGPFASFEHRHQHALISVDKCL